MTGPTAPAATWFARAYHEIKRDRHLLLYGNIDDLVLWNDTFQPMTAALPAFLCYVGFAAVARYDLVDGLKYADDGSQGFVESRLGAPAADPAVPVAQPETRRGAQLAESERELLARIGSAGRPVVIRALDMLHASRRLLDQRDRACAMVIDQADLIFGKAGEGEDQYQANLACLRKMITSGEHAPDVDGQPLRNVVVLLATRLSTLPDWVHCNNPHVAVIEIPHPSTTERADFLRGVLGGFHGGAELSPEEVGRLAGTLANLTDGMSILDIQALRATSRLAEIAPTKPRKLVLRHRFGLRDDPWEQLDMAKVVRAEEILSRRVIGQDTAVRTVADVLVNARIGVDFVADPDGSSTQPKGVFFFVGPTGVGKTELAKAIAELVFDDETALRRFDMSEFSQEHASERLTGAPPGFVGYENGGVLTNWMLERPFSVVLFDEIEKANPKIFDKFLQIIDDGRLTDGLGRTAHFSQAVVIFTSNLGASDLAPLMSGYPADAPPPYPVVQEHFRGAVAEYLAQSLGRPELLGRLGSGIVAFDILRADMIAKIVGKFLGQLGASAAARGYELIFDRRAIDKAVTDAVTGNGSALGARQIRSPLLEEWVRRPLNRWLIEHAPPPGSRLWVHRGKGSPPFVVDEFPAEDT
ncbi:AAA family ATPase [Actinocrispum wychmicini]|uniref:Cdc48 subfamily AAA family protein n=1 Tax=Actinocrispum wychmicini TaxID=1213861 RepID=A0A4R2IRU5_9PSEU|nr:AAA family ATPase [Actinocrispum wychmicini]TCO48023.1 Cdc48 subfamily AAA family protein [Actinocrispum wychmicini]